MTTQIIKEEKWLQILQGMFRGEADRRLVNVMLGSGAFGTAPLISAPGVPGEQVKMLRAAYASALNDGDLVAEAKKKGLEPALISGEDLESLVKEVINQPAEVIAAMKKVMGG